MTTSNEYRGDVIWTTTVCGHVSPVLSEDNVKAGDERVCMVCEHAHCRAVVTEAPAALVDFDLWS